MAEPPSSAPFRLAIAFSGAVGSFGGAIPLTANASAGSEAASSGLFNVSSSCWRRTLLDSPATDLRFDIFVHSWSVRLEQQITAALRPTRSKFEPQPAFPRLPFAPSLQHHLLARRLRCHEVNRSGYSYVHHQSLWASRLRAMALVVEQEQSTGVKFDAVLLTRLDMCPCQREPLTAAPFRLLAGTVVRVGVFHPHCGLPVCGNPFTHDFVSDAEYGQRLAAGEVADLVERGRKAWRLRAQPRVEDTLLLGTAAALHNLSAAALRRLPNATLSMGECDTHGCGAGRRSNPSCALPNGTYRDLTGPNGT